ncbi:uncharacterized protein [Nicotiana sylvestris]|uniref:uncharacterized protein n=1 Tax=Nicotiana sylvestris TaxID=4096 RepID=UPI00388C5E20
MLEPVVPKAKAPMPRPPPPYPQRLAKQNSENQFKKFINITKSLSINVPLVEALEQMLGYAKFKKDIVTKKRSMNCEIIKMTHQVRAIVRLMASKLEDLGAFTIPCTIGSADFAKALCDLGASINLMPYSVFKTLGIGQPRPISMRLQMADRTMKRPLGIIDDVFVHVDKFILLVDFVILDCEVDYEVPIILGRPFLTMGKDLVDVEAVELTFQVGDEKVVFHVCKSISATMNVEDNLKVVLLNLDNDEENEGYVECVESTLEVLQRRKRAIGWTLADIVGIIPAFCMYKIILKEGAKPFVENQRRLNEEMQEVVKKEIIKWLDVGVVYPIFDSSWTSLVQCVPKKGGMTVVTNDKNKLIPTRTVTGWRDAKFHLNEDCMKAFKLLKFKLTTTLIITAPDWSLPFELMCDASDVTVGAVLGQRIKKIFHLVYYASKIMNDVQVNYRVNEKELLVIVFDMDKFRPYLMGTKVIVHTDHAALRHLMSKKDSKASLMQWVLLLQEFDIEIQDYKGSENQVADHLSRLEEEGRPHDGLEINDSFPDEQFLVVSMTGMPWFADLANYLGADNLKFKGKATTSVGQSEEPAVVVNDSAVEPSTDAMPSTTVGPSTGATAMPPSTSSRLSVPASSTYLQTVLRVSQTLSAAPAAPQVPPLVEETLKKILENQKTIMETLVAHGEIIEELGKQTKKMQKTQASKRSVDKLRKAVAKIASAGDLPLDLLIEGVPSDPVAQAALEALHIAAGQSEELVATVYTTEEMIQMLSNPVVHQIAR